MAAFRETACVALKTLLVPLVTAILLSIAAASAYADAKSADTITIGKLNSSIIRNALHFSPSRRGSRGSSGTRSVSCFSGFRARIPIDVGCESASDVTAHNAEQDEGFSFEMF